MLTRRGLLGGALALGGLGLVGVGRAARRVVDDDEVLALAEARLWPWEGGPRGELVEAHDQNPEWDLMSRLFLAVALGDLAEHNPDLWADRAIRALDGIIRDTELSVQTYGQAYFLMSYWNVGRCEGSGRSLFLDGERLMMMAVRRLIRDDDGALARASRTLDAEVRGSMALSPLGCAESYPHECWTFCNTVALAAGAMMDALEGTDHSGQRAAWAEMARDHLIDPFNGLLVSSFRPDGTPRDGPEGSTIWLVAHMLRLIDPALAADQYERARTLLGRTLLGLGYAREWPPGQVGSVDVDSGPIVPVLQASPSSSGLAVLASRSFEDWGWHRALRLALRTTAMPREQDGRLRFAASNAVGDAVLLAGMVAGPLWARLLGAAVAPG